MSELVPKLRFGEFRTPLERLTLEQITSKKISYGIVQAGEHYEGGMPYIKSKDLNTDIKIELLNCTSPEIAEKYKRSEVTPGDIVFSLRGNIGVTQIIPDSIPVANLTQGTARISVKPDICNKFIQAELQTKRVKTKIDAVSKGSTFQEISLAELRKVQVLVPLKQEQQKIANFLTSVDTKISQLTEKHRLLKEYKKGVMQQIFSQQIRFKDENGEAFPEWEKRKGNQIFDAISDKNHKSDLPILAITQEYGAIPRDMINYDVQVTDNSISGYKVVQKGDFIISLRSFQGGIEYSNYHGICSPAYIILRPNTDINDDFFRFYLKTFNFIQEMQKRLEGIRDGKILSYKYFSEINLPYPSLAEQQKIAQYLQAIDAKINAVNQQIEQAKLFKKGLLQQMFV